MREDKYRTGLKRFWAAVIDFIIFWGPMQLYLKFRVASWISFSDSNELILSDFMAHYTELEIVRTCWVLLSTIYPVFCHYKFGCTIGKWVTQVEVLDVSETRKLSFLQAVLRDIVPVAVLAGGLLYWLFLLITASEERSDQLQAYYNFTSFFPACWVLLEIISMFTNAKRRGVHDFLARSVVVRMPEDRSRLSKVVYHS